jgi:hypothetical protein
MEPIVCAETSVPNYQPTLRLRFRRAEVHLHAGGSMKYRKTRHLMLYREITAVCSEIHTKQINTLCGQNVGFLKVLGGTESNHWPLNDQRSVPNSIIVSTENSIPVHVRTFCMGLNWNDGEMLGLTDNSGHVKSSSKLCCWTSTKFTALVLLLLYAAPSLRELGCTVHSSKYSQYSYNLNHNSGKQGSSVS